MLRTRNFRQAGRERREGEGDEEGEHLYLKTLESYHNIEDVRDKAPTEKCKEDSLTFKTAFLFELFVNFRRPC